ncbi:MAG: hypothetical protein ACJZ40_00615 [Candidatus Poseidoniaceae archaeon]
MGSAGSVRFHAVAMVTLFVLSTLLLGYTPSDASSLGAQQNAHEAVTLGQAESITIGSFPDGASTKVELEIPDGEAIQGIDIDVEHARLQSSMAASWTESNDFSNGAVYDGMDVNGSSLSILPQGWEWDFENANHGWTLGSPAWLWGFDTSLGQATSVSSGTKAIYTYNGNYPNGMGSTIWATSPVMDCSSCSGSWDLDFMKRLGVESSTWDHAYVSVKSTNGNWVNVYSNSGSVNDGSMTSQTISITNYVAGNANFQVRFGIGTTDSSVTYTGWNVDDVSVLPTASGVSSGEGNWTSAAFGPSQFGQGENKAYGYLHIDAVIPANSVFEWRLLDAVTLQPVAGFEHMTGVSVDLGVVDWTMHPLVRLDLHMQSGSMGIPTVHGFHFNGILFEDFDQDPTNQGWQLQSQTWSPGQLSGSGSAVSPIYNVRSGFGGILSNSVLSGSAVLEATVDGGLTWDTITPGVRHLFDGPEFSAQLRLTSSGGSWTLDTLDIELIRTSVVDDLRFDVALDGVADWSMALPEVGRLGIQDGFLDGSLWQSRASSPSAPALYDLALPLDGVNAFEFAVASPAAPSVNPTVKLSVDGQEVVSKSVPTIQDLTFVRLTSSELANLNSALSQAVATHGPKGLPLASVGISIGSSSSMNSFVAGGIFAPYDGALSMAFTASDPLVVALNNELTSQTAIGGVKTISMPIRMGATGAISITVDQINTQSSVDPVSIQVSNVSDTFVASTEWIEVSSTFDFAPLGVTDAASYVKTNGWSVVLQLQGLVRSSHITCPFVSLPAEGNLGCSTQGAPMVWSDNGALGSKQITGSGSFLQIDHRFKFTEQWDDEDSLTLSVNLISPSGPMIPVSMNYGLGDAQGVENDVQLTSWRSVNQVGVGTELAHPYLHPGEVVTIEADLDFEGLANSPSPRSGSVDVCFYVDDVQNQCTSVYNRGVASFPWNVPSGKQSVDLRIELVPLQGQSVSYAVSNTATFNFDVIAPELLGMNVATFDHMDAGPNTALEFRIADRPVLPSHAYVHMWRSWLDDANMDGIMDAEEVSILELQVPENRSQVQADYLYSFDSSSYQSGAMMRGWLDVADSAGNPMLASGTIESPLFNLQINNDGAPQLGSTPATWNTDGEAWLHPGEHNLLSVPVWDMNGISDLATIEIDLASNRNTPVFVSWNATTNLCESNNIFVEIESCLLEAVSSEDVFSTEGMFHVNFSLEWGFDPDVSLKRTPSVLVHDRSGQSNVASLPLLDWRFSGEFEIPQTSMSFDVEGTPMDALGTWIQPRSEIGVSGDLVWYRSQHPVVQSVDLQVDIGGTESVMESINGSFSDTITAPLSPGTYGLTTSLSDPPNGAIDRTEPAPFAYFIVDPQAPSVVGVASPPVSGVIEESSWADLKFEIMIDEEDRLNEESLTLNWAVHEEGLGLSSPIIVNGSVMLEVVGGRAYGSMIPTEAQLNLDEQLTTTMRSKALELRIYVTGSDVAGYPMVPIFNDLDAPLSVWALEQRVAEYTFLDPGMKPSKDLAEGDVVTLAVTIENNGRADGLAQMFVERVESNGARTRIDAREIQIPAGGQLEYSKDWMPDRSGTMWIEYHIISGPSAQTNTVFVDEPRTEGVLGSVAAVNPVLLIIIFLLSVSLVAVLLFGLQSPQPKNWNVEQSKAVDKALPTLSKPVDAPESGPYGAEQASSSPGENPYQ